MALTEADVKCAYQAQTIGQQHRGWVVMWSLWHRTFTAFSCFSSTPVVIEAATPEELTLLLRQAELHHAVASTARMAGRPDVPPHPHGEAAPERPGDGAYRRRGYDPTSERR